MFINDVVLVIPAFYQDGTTVTKTDFAVISLVKYPFIYLEQASKQANKFMWTFYDLQPFLTRLIKLNKLTSNQSIISKWTLNSVAIKHVLFSLKPNLYASWRCHEMNQKWLTAKFKLSCWPCPDEQLLQFLEPILSRSWSFPIMAWTRNVDQTNMICLLQDLTHIFTQKYNQKCTQKGNQLLNFPVHTKNYVWLTSWWRV